MAPTGNQPVSTGPIDKERGADTEFSFAQTIVSTWIPACAVHKNMHTTPKCRAVPKPRNKKLPLERMVGFRWPATPTPAEQRFCRLSSLLSTPHIFAGHPSQFFSQGECSSPITTVNATVISHHITTKWKLTSVTLVTSTTKWKFHHQPGAFMVQLAQVYRLQFRSQLHGAAIRVLGRTTVFRHSLGAAHRHWSPGRCGHRQAPVIAQLECRSSGKLLFSMAYCWPVLLNLQVSGRLSATGRGT